MAIIWFFKSGEIQKGSSIASESLDWCVQHLDLRPSQWIAELETKNLKIGDEEDPRRAPPGGFRFAVVQIDNTDLSDGWITGFHLLEKNAMEVRKILDKN